MPAFLVLWNPKLEPWGSYERERLRGGAHFKTWSTGQRKAVPVGSRIYLVKLGKEPRGLAATGTSVSPVLPRTDPGKFGPNFVKFRVDTMFPRDEPLPMAELERAAPVVNWHPRGGGNVIDDEARLAVDALVRGYSPDASPGFDETAGEVEGHVSEVFRNHYLRERGMRDRKLAQHAKLHGGALPCENCGFDFFQAFGRLGKGYAQVHHKVALSTRERPSVTRLHELAVLCANCHAMVHRDNKCRRVEEVRPKRRFNSAQRSK